MPLTQIQKGSFESGAIETADLSSNTTAAFAVSLAPKVTTVNVANSSYTVLDDTAVNTGGGYIVVTGSSFQSGAVVLVDTTQATSTTFVNSTTLRAQLPSKSAGTYNVYVANPDGGVGVKLNGVNYSASPIWVTTSPLANVTSNTAFTGSLSATGATSYANTTELPTGMTLVGANGYYYGTISVSSDTTYSFTINATDAENQDSPATFNLTAVAVFLDTYFNSTTLLLTGNGTNNANNNVFQDSSSNNFAITRNGNTTQGSFSPFSPTGWSNYFDGDDDYLSHSSSTTLNFGTSDFTVECWMNLGNTLNSKVLVGGTALNSFGFRYGTSFNTNNGLSIYRENAADLENCSFAFAANTWYHVVVVRQSGVIKFFINGTQQSTSGSGGGSYNFQGETSVRIGIGATGVEDYIGYISNLRVVKGTAVYTSNFTPPTAPLTAVSGTSLLTCQSNRFVDNSTNNFAIGRTGDVSVQAFSPFAPATAWSAATHGGSLYLDGTGDWIEITSPTSALVCPEDFTFECWTYTSLSQPFYVGGQYNNQNAIPGEWILYFETDGTGILYLNGDSNPRITISTAGTFKKNEWQHNAIVRSGSTVTLYVNGVSVGTATKSDNFGRTGVSLDFGSYYTNTESSRGYISGVRLLKGTALYTSNFTPPTTPPTNITNTQLLLNFTNAGIYDTTAKNVIETAGNVKVNTTIVKNETGSIYFDGTGDYLSIPNNPVNSPEGGNFTVEAWVYNLGYSGSQFGRGIISLYNSPSGNRLLLRLDNNSDKVNMYLAMGGTAKFGISGTLSTASLTPNSWVHLAFVRESSTFKLYLNGTLDTTISGVSDTLTNFNTLEIGRCQDGTTPDFNGYLDDVRITRGLARYTTNFTPPGSLGVR